MDCITKEEEIKPTHIFFGLINLICTFLADYSGVLMIPKQEPFYMVSMSSWWLWNWVDVYDTVKQEEKGNVDDCSEDGIISM